MPNVYARPTALSNVSGRIDYVSNPDRQEHLVCTYNSAHDLQFWSELAAHCRQSAAEAGHDKACEAREWHAALPNQFAEIYKDNEEQLAMELSLIFKSITGTENFVGIHWNEDMTNFHFHCICSENKEINEVTYGAELTRNTYYNELGKRSTKKECVDQDGNLKPGCTFYKKGERIQKVKRFGSKENLRHHTVNEKIKKALADKYNKTLDTDLYRVYTDDGLHLKTQKVGKDKPAELKAEIEQKNQLVIEYNNKVDELLLLTDGTKQQEKEIETLKKRRNDIKKHRMTPSWLKAIRFHTEKIMERIEKLTAALEEFKKAREEKAAALKDSEKITEPVRISEPASKEITESEPDPEPELQLRPGMSIEERMRIAAQMADERNAAKRKNRQKENVEIER